MELNDEFFMKEALVEAKKAFIEDEVPVGAVLVYEGKIIARAHNRVEQLQDASLHAEMQCLRLGASSIQNWRVSGMSLYCTLEPCLMCAGAMLSFRLTRLVWGASDTRQGVYGSWINLLQFQHPIHHLSLTGGLLKDEASQLMVEFFRQKRKRQALRGCCSIKF